MSDQSTPSLDDGGVVEIQEVRYSLAELLKELRHEQTSSVFSKQLLDQVEISKIFQQRRKIRAQAKKS
jgi:hypothetical protein